MPAPGRCRVMTQACQREKRNGQSVVTFKTNRLSAHITRIDGAFHERVYLVQGQDAAALIDTASGFGSIKAVVDHLTDKPLIVLLTHGHVDHAMGAGEFSKVYMNYRDIPVFLRQSDPQFRWNVIKNMPAAKLLQPEDYLPAADPGRFLNLDDGDSFDLGGIHLDIFRCPGHTPGSVVVLVREERVLLIGDACSNFTFLGSQEALPIPAYEENLRRLKRQTDGKYDTVLEAHGTGWLQPGIIQGVIDVCEDIRLGHTDDVPCCFAGYHGVLAKARIAHTTCRLDKGTGNIFYIKKAPSLCARTRCGG